MGPLKPLQPSDFVLCSALDRGDIAKSRVVIIDDGQNPPCPIRVQQWVMPAASRQDGKDKLCRDGKDVPDRPGDSFWQLNMDAPLYPLWAFGRLADKWFWAHKDSTDA